MLLAVQTANRGLRFLVGRHLDETEAFAPARVAVRNDLGALNGAILRKQFLQLLAIHRVAQMSNVQLLAHLGISCGQIPPGYQRPGFNGADKGC